MSPGCWQAGQPKRPSPSPQLPFCRAKLQRNAFGRCILRSLPSQSSEVARPSPGANPLRHAFLSRRPSQDASASGRLSGFTPLMPGQTLVTAASILRLKQPASGFRSTFIMRRCVFTHAGGCRRQHTSSSGNHWPPRRVAGCAGHRGAVQSAWLGQFTELLPVTPSDLPCLHRRGPSTAGPASGAKVSAQGQKRPHPVSIVYGRVKGWQAAPWGTTLELVQHQSLCFRVCSAPGHHREGHFHSWGPSWVPGACTRAVPTRPPAPGSQVPRGWSPPPWGTRR